MDKKYDGKTLVCRTKYDEQNITGRISFSDEFVKIRLVGFEEFVHFNSEDDISFQLEDNAFCTVSPISTSPGSIASAGFQSNFLDINVSQAILGFRPWTSFDRVREFQFKLSDSNDLLTAPDIEKLVTSANFDNPPDSKIFEVVSGLTTLTISLDYKSSRIDANYQVDGVFGKVVFAESQTIDQVGSLIGKLRTFFSMAAGIEVVLSDYWIVPNEGGDQPLISIPASFQLIWPSGRRAKPFEYGRSKPTSILRCWNETDRKTTADCLKFWMDNWPEWKNAFSGVFVAVKEGRNFNSNRILDACKWLESTPGTEQSKLEINNELCAIAACAIQKSRDLGLNMDPRISGAIKQLGTESRNDLFLRLVDLVVPNESKEIKERFRKDLHKAYSFRGDFAHSKFYHSSDGDVRGYVRAIKAIEALSFLLLFRQLPLPEDHRWPNGPGNFVDYFNWP